MGLFSFKHIISIVPTRLFCAIVNVCSNNASPIPMFCHAASTENAASAFEGHE